jgi:Asp-tRNA(Asn)/Glu-tRNA(Gln) amidotransferase A subunit family amidase
VGKDVVPDASWDASMETVVAGVTAGTRSAADWTRVSRGRIEARDAEVQAWVCLSDRADSEASSRDTSDGTPGPLQGVPIGVKDIIDVAGLPTRCGSTITSPDPVATSAACVRQLESLGAVVQGKTATTEFAYFQPGPTRNPRAPGRTPGGSSSGSAAAVAAGMVPLALGSQTAGSVSRPAAYCGVAGMVLAHGIVDLTGIAGLSESLDSFGLIARGVADLAYAYGAMVGRPGASQSPTRVLVWEGSGLDRIEPAMRQALELAVGHLRQLGYPVSPLGWDDHVQMLAEDHALIMAYEAARERPDAVARIDEISAPLAQLLRTGQGVTDEDHRHALVRVKRSSYDLDELLADDALILGPAALGPPPEGLGATGSPILSRPWQALGRPVIVIPGVTTADNLPLGLQLVGQAGAEGRLLAEAQRLEDGVRGRRTVA